MSVIRCLVAGLAIVLILAACQQEEQTDVPKTYSEMPAMQIDPSKTYKATIETTHGEMVAELYTDDAPIAVNSFVFLAREGFYTDVKVHRIIKGFVIQTGDPTGTGSGGPGYTFPDEPIKREYLVGTLAMANRGPDTNGSQFFIVLAEGRLSKDYTIFGQVIEGLDTLKDIENLPVEASGGGEMSKPTVDIRVKSVTVEES